MTLSQVSFFDVNLWVSRSGKKLRTIIHDAKYCRSLRWQVSWREFTFILSSL